MHLGDQDTVFLENYVFDSRLGAGGMGVVYLAHSPSGREVAVKVVHKQLAADPEFRARFHQEVAAARRVSGAFTAPVVDADADAERLWMATLYVAGPTLAEKVREEGPLPVEQVWQLAAGMAEALRDIHRAGVVHRDLKPSNVLLAADGPKVIDFGISRPHDSSLRTETGKVIGTPPFMAPEQFRTPRDVGPAADVFALGCLLVHAVLGRGPFDADSPYLVAYQVVHDEPDLDEVPDELRPLVRACLSKDPADRPTPGELMSRVAVAMGNARPAGRDPEGGRRQDPGAERGRGRGAVRAPDPEPPAEPEPEDTPAPDGDQRVNGDRRHRGRRPVLLAVVAAVLLAGGGFFGAQALDSSGRAPAPAGEGQPHQEGGTEARSWETRVASAGSEPPREVHAPRCSLAGTALYCADRGVAAARISTEDGAVEWSVAAERTDLSQGWVHVPRSAGGLVHTIQQGGGTLAALEPRSGSVRWRVDVSEQQNCCVAIGDTVLSAGGDGTVTALDAGSGRERWRTSFPEHPAPAMTSFGGTAYLFDTADDGATTVVSAVRPESGAVPWKQRFSGVLTPIGAHGDVLFLLEYDPEVATRAIAVVRHDARSGTTRAALPYSIDGASAAVAGDMVYVLANNGTLLAVDTGEGRAGPVVKWELPTSVSNPSPPVVAGHRLFLSASDGRLLAVDLRRGQLTGQTAQRLDPTLHGMLADQPPPLVAGGRVFGFTPRGTVFSVPVDSLDG
ncbi:serine/threonine-protein kinase [Wenjunlia vitaminophila]|nr:serine/threonine-protein kinase [Wenjunlia vitaminophila]